MNAFPFQYVGGGWFRDRDAPKGEPAEVFHGDQIVAFARQFFSHRTDCMRVFFRDNKKACTCGRGAP